MKKYFILILSFISLSILSQEEKRLALVIGNANYDKGELNNPVNDALLIKETLEKLNFDVIYAIDLESKRSMVDKIAEFGRKRENYDVGFVYYAGHGVQVGGENYLLPTKEIFESEYDVEDYGVSVQKIMRYLTGMSQQVNVLILDACRDNPFESYWNKSRSIKGAGLAKIPPPTGSLIAFSTSSNTTAADGDGKNSLYCQSLAKNLQLENTSIDQVFRNVRSELIEFSKGFQIPEESSKLIGSAYILNKTNSIELIKSSLSGHTKEEYFNLGVKSQKNNNLEKSLDYFSKSIELDSMFLDALIKRGLIHNDLKMYKKGLLDNNKVVIIDSNLHIGLINRSVSFMGLQEYEKALDDLNRAINLETSSLSKYAYYQRGFLYKTIGDFENALKDFNTVIKIDSNYLNSYSHIINLYLNLGRFELAYDMCNKVISMDSNYSGVYHNLGSYYGFKGDLMKAIENYTKSVELDSNLIESYAKRGYCYMAIDSNLKAIEDFNYVLKNEKSAKNYYNRGTCFAKLGIYKKALPDFTSAIDLQPSFGLAHFNRGLSKFLLENEGYCIDMNRACHLNVETACKFLRKECGKKYQRKNKIN